MPQSHAQKSDQPHDRFFENLAVQTFNLGPIRFTKSLSDLLEDGRGMMLYHGTNSYALPSILETGLRPRLESQEPNHPEMPSEIGYSYLSTVFAPWYAINSTDDSHNEDARPVIIEIDPDKLDFSMAFPDEDFLDQIVELKQMSRSRDGGVGSVEPLMSLLAIMDPVADHVERADQNMNACQSLWRYSLNWLGNIAYSGVIPVSAMTRYVIQDKAPHALAWQVGLGFEPNLTYHALYAYAMRGLTDHLFDGASLFAEWDDPAYLNALPQETMMQVRQIKKRMRQERNKWTKVFRVH